MNTESPTTEDVIEIVSSHRYPIGEFEWGKSYSEEEIQDLIKTLDEFPVRLKKLISEYSESQLDAPYREHGWTIRQVVHHLADSHMNAYIRFKLALTEDKPTIKPYNEKAWAELVDSKTLPPSVSLGILAGVHERWTTILHRMNSESFHRTFFHPEHMKLHELVELLAMYAWHSNHHFAHIQLVKPEKKIPEKKTVKAQKAPSKKALTKKATAKKTAKKK